MVDVYKVFKDRNARLGGFYELSIQVCPAIIDEAIIKYTKFFWSKENIDGPLCVNQDNVAPCDVKYSSASNEGIVRIGEYAIPFVQANIKETTPIESGFNWFNVSFYEPTLNQVFETQNIFSQESKNHLSLIDNFLVSLMKELFIIHSFELAMVDFEMSGQHYLDSLENPEFNNYTNSQFYIDILKQDSIPLRNQVFVEFLEKKND